MNVVYVLMGLAEIIQGSVFSVENDNFVYTN